MQIFDAARTGFFHLGNGLFGNRFRRLPTIVAYPGGSPGGPGHSKAIFSLRPIAVKANPIGIGTRKAVKK